MNHSDMKWRSLSQNYMRIIQTWSREVYHRIIDELFRHEVEEFITELYMSHSDMKRLFAIVKTIPANIYFFKVNK